MNRIEEAMEPEPGDENCRELGRFDRLMAWVGGKLSAFDKGASSAYNK